ncbi:hypothetical protein [Neobacillus terrae]|uniref:hypothetical protein n=1 Tax=Neobacillus terrae TaxID=3034837 RepID=UPI001409C0F6|nr:hypothetical protein [Neobacillus terrae]NHM32214.1 hypothetical protein [Neobacillus terrae]
MLKRLVVAMVTVAVFLSGIAVNNANAEGAFQPEKFPYKELQIQVMPEFDYPDNWPKDQPSLLVGQYGTIINKSGTDFDGKIEIPVPVKEKSFQVYLVAEFPSQDKPEVQRPYEVDKEKGVVSWKPQKPIKNNESYRFVVEYYSNPIDVKDTKRFSFNFKNYADTDLMDVIFYAPISAKEIQLDPKPQNSSKSEYGEPIYYYSYKNVKKGNSLDYKVSYKKKDNESTLSAIDKKQPPNDSNHSGVKGGGTATDQILNNSKSGENSKEKQPFISNAGAVIIGLSLIIAAAFVYFGLTGRNRMNARSQTVSKKKPKTPAPKKQSKLDNENEKKELRKKLLNGKIDQETYEEEMKKLI